MAYEQIWNFIPPQGPFTALSRVEGYARWLWYVKSMLTGGLSFDGISSIPANPGLWTVAGSSDGVTSNMSGVDLWGATYDYTKIPTGANYGWICLSKVLASKTVYIVLANKDLGFSGPALWSTFAATGNVTYNGAINGVPAFQVMLTYANMPYSNNSASTYGDNFTAARRFYGGLSADGTFWAGQTIGGDVESGLLFAVPVGTKVADPYPYFYRAQAAGYTGGGFGPQFVNITNFANTTLYNGTAGHHRVMPPTDSKILDSTDFSVFDFPCFIECYNNSTIASATVRHSRGRLPDVGITTGATAAASASTRPVSNGVVFRDGAGDIHYVAMDYMILPYNAPVV